MSSKRMWWMVIGLSLMLAGCGDCSQASNSLLAAPMAQAEQAATAASSSLTPDSTPPIAVTLTFSEYLTLTAGDVWPTQLVSRVTVKDDQLDCTLEVNGEIHHFTAPIIRGE